MRIIAGIYRGRRLQGPQGHVLRPTTDRVREALFAILGPRCMGARVLDLFAGTGAVGIEALSRGAVHVTFVEADRRAVRILRANLLQCSPRAETVIRPCLVHQFLRQSQHWMGPYDILFADPPYDDALAELSRLDTVLTDQLLAPHGVAIMEHGRKAVVPTQLGPLQRLRRYDYGDTSLTVYTDSTGPTRVS